MHMLPEASTNKKFFKSIVFTNPETIKPAMKLFEVIAPADSQDTSRLKDVIKPTFIKHSMKFVSDKIVFLGFNSPSVNIGKNSGLTMLSQGD